MKLNSLYIKTPIIVLVLCFFSSCSTKKKTWVNRQYHNTTAKFNGYFNGKQSLSLGVKKLHSKHVDDYTEIISVFPTGDLKKSKTISSYAEKAIKKGSIVIQRHSIKIKGKEYCKWIDENYLMVGKGYFYKGDFDEAIKTFNFIKNEYKKNEIRFESSIWLVRSYAEKKDFTSAEFELQEILSNKRFPKKLKKESTLVAADLHIKTKEYDKAILDLLSVTKTIKNKRKKVRINYILAQLYQNSNNNFLAQKHYQKVLSSNPEYEMAFNAKMNLARSLEKGNTDVKKTKQKLIKMTKDDKNKEYLDQIYYTIAEMEINNEDTISAIKNYTLSTINSVENNAQKALSFLELGKIDFKKKLYKTASMYYDSTVFYMDNDHRFFEKTKDKQLILSDLVLKLNIVQLQDSLQMVAKLPKSQQNKIINSIIQAEIEKERKEAEEERLRKQMMYEGARNGGRGEIFGNNTSGGKWYFYNPATLSFGISEFRKKWGKRKLEDNWRRKDKKTSNDFETDSTKTDSVFSQKEDTKNPKYYLDKLPKNKKDFENSDNQIKEAYYQLALIYRESLKEIALSNSSFLSIFKRFPKDEPYSSLALYNIYLNHSQTNSPQKKKTKETLLLKYPHSIYAEIIKNPNYKTEELTKEDVVEKKYQEIFSFYQKNKFKEVILKTKNIEKDKYKHKKLLLRAFSFIQKNEKTKAINILNNIPLESKEEYNRAQEVLMAINDPSKMNKANEIAITGSSYLYRAKEKHMIILVLPKKDVDITYLKTLISDFHTNKIGNDVFEISALLLGLDNHLLMVKGFQEGSESMEYYELFKEEKTVMNFLNNSSYRIMSISIQNFQEFYKNRDTEGYYNFFINNYITNN